MKRVEIGPEDLAPGEVRSLTIEGRLIALAKSPDGRLHALKGVCPHQQAPLGAGWTECPIDADGVGAYRLDRGRLVLRCPWHGLEFDLETGRSLVDPERMRVKAYPVTVEQGRLFIDV